MVKSLEAKSAKIYVFKAYPQKALTSSEKPPTDLKDRITRSGFDTKHKGRWSKAKPDEKVFPRQMKSKQLEKLSSLIWLLRLIQRTPKKAASNAAR